MHLEGAAADFGCLGVPLDLHLGVFGWPLPSILGAKGTPGRLWRAGGSKDRLPGLGSLHFMRFLIPKGSEKFPKMELNSKTKSIICLPSFSSRVFFSFWTFFVDFRGFGHCEARKIEKNQEKKAKKG